MLGAIRWAPRIPGNLGAFAADRVASEKKGIFHWSRPLNITLCTNGPYRNEPRTVLLGMTRRILECWTEIKDFIDTCPWTPEKKIRQRGQNLVEFNRKRQHEREQQDQALYEVP